MDRVFGYPVHLGIAYILLVGYLFRIFFVSLRLPASIGVLVNGFAFSYFFQADLYQARWSFQELAMFLVLLQAGLEIRMRDLQPYIFVMASLPFMFEVMAILLYGHFKLDFEWKDAMLLGVVLSGSGPGLVIPKMKEFAQLKNHHPLPRLMYTWTPLEGSLALFFFGVLESLNADEDQTYANFGLLALASFLRILATLVVGYFFGALSGWLIPRRTQLTLNGERVFTGLAIETFLMVLAVALIAYSLGASYGRKELVPMGFTHGSLFQSELMVIVTGLTFAHFAEREAHEMEEIMGGLWIFGQLTLFSIIGSRTSIDILPKIAQILPVMGIGVLMRLAGVLAALFLTRRARGCEAQSYWSTIKDAAFCFLATLPRATLQAALGSHAMMDRLFRGAGASKEAELFVLTASRVYMCCMSVVGQTLLNWFGPMLMEWTNERPEEEHCKGLGVESHRDRAPRPSQQYSEPGSDASTESALWQLAEEYDMDPRILEGLLEEAAKVSMNQDHEKEEPVLPRQREHSEDIYSKVFLEKHLELPGQVPRIHSDPGDLDDAIDLRPYQYRTLHGRLAETMELETKQEHRLLTSPAAACTVK